MTWPPFKAWTSKAFIDKNKYFVAINYGGELENRWVVLMSVLDSSVVLKLSWSQLSETTNWECGWDENINSDSSKLVNNKAEIISESYTQPSTDSGLTIPITKNFIRPWFRKI